MSPKAKLLWLGLGAGPAYAVVALFALRVLKIGAIQFGVFSVIVACGFGFWLATVAREYAEEPKPLTDEEKKAGEEAMERLMARKKKR
ncbi:MAG: hypothetical protein NTV52_25890 [Acidobacteria bacterium]|nr:hypothetical protein [Acidobacteriota bacterium]